MAKSHAQWFDIAPTPDNSLSTIAKWGIMRLLGKPSRPEVASTMLNIVPMRWPDIEEAKDISALGLLLGQAYICPLNPGVKDFPEKQRAVALALSVAITKPGFEHFGRDGCLKLGRAAADFASLHGEMRLYNDIMVACRYANARNLEYGEARSNFR